jgi:hypothetical protein
MNYPSIAATPPVAVHAPLNSHSVDRPGGPSSGPAPLRVSNGLARTAPVKTYEFRIDSVPNDDARLSVRQRKQLDGVAMIALMHHDAVITFGGSAAGCNASTPEFTAEDAATAYLVSKGVPLNAFDDDVAMDILPDAMVIDASATPAARQDECAGPAPGHEDLVIQVRKRVANFPDMDEYLVEDVPAQQREFGPGLRRQLDIIASRTHGVHAGTVMVEVAEAPNIEHAARAADAVRAYLVSRGVHAGAFARWASEVVDLVPDIDKSTIEIYVRRIPSPDRLLVEDRRKI